jgi:hypothetical protein
LPVWQLQAQIIQTPNQNPSPQECFPHTAQPNESRNPEAFEIATCRETLDYLLGDMRLHYVVFLYWIKKLTAARAVIMMKKHSE